MAIVNVLIAVLSLVARVAFAVIASNMVPTCSMYAGVWSTVVGVCFTVDSLVSSRTGTHIGVFCFTARPPMLARLVQTFVDVFLTFFAPISRRADALVVILPIDAGGSVFTLIVFAVVDVSLALATSVSRLAKAGVSVHLILAFSPILAFDALGNLLHNPKATPPTHLTLIDVIFTEFSLEASDADARAVANAVNTGSPIFTVDSQAVVQVDLTACAVETKEAGALVSGNLGIKER